MTTNTRAAAALLPYDIFDLAACPFCAKKNAAHVGDPEKPGLGFYIACTTRGCPCSLGDRGDCKTGYFNSQEEAARAWNTRTTPAQENGSASEGAPVERRCEHGIRWPHECTDCTQLSFNQRMPDSMRDWLTGMSVSVDVSTDEHDAKHRYFGTVTEVMDSEDKHQVILLVQDAEPNFERKPHGGAVSEDVRNLISEYERVGPKYWNGIGCFAQSWAEGAMKVLREYERARASDPPGADAGVGEAADRFERWLDREWPLWRNSPNGLHMERLRKAFIAGAHPSATNNMSHPAVREVTIEDANELVRVFYNWDKSSPREENDNTCFLAALKSIHAVIAEAGVVK